MKYKILFIENSRSSNLLIGGSHKSLYNLLQGLDKNKYEPVLLLNQYNNYMKRFIELNISVHFINYQEWDIKKIIDKNNRTEYSNGTENRKLSILKNIKSQLGILFRLFHTIIPMTIRTLRVIKKINPDIIHTNTRIGSNQHGILAAWLSNKKLICHERLWTPKNWLNACLIHIPKKIICISKSIKNHLISFNLDKSKLVIINNGRKITGGRPHLGKFEDCNNKLKIGIFSTIDESKGHTIFINGAIKLLRKFPDFKFYIYGSKTVTNRSYIEYLNRLIRESGNNESIFFKGLVDDVNIELRKLHLTCCLTIYDEPLSGTIIEGFINGTIVIASNNGGSPELINNGYNGLLVYPNSIESFVAAIDKLNNDSLLMKKLTLNGYEYAVKNLSDTVYIKNVCNVYKDIG